MNIKKPLFTVQCFMAFMAVLFFNIQMCSAQSDPPNVVIIFIDDMGYGDLSSFSNQVISTPHIDSLAMRGMKFTKFYVNSPICSPSRAALMTGKYPMHWKIHSYIERREENERRAMNNWLDEGAPTLAKVFKENGYRTGHFGKWHLGGGRDVGDAPLPSAYGFDQSLVSFEGLGNRILFPDDRLSEASSKLGQGPITWVEKHKSTEIYVDSALNFIQENPDDPFYIHLFPNDVHDPHLPSIGAIEKYKDVARSTSEARFFAVLEELDKQIGRFIESLKEMGKLENTIVVFTSDNGPTDWPSYYRNGEYPPGNTGGLLGRKWSLYEGGIRMPFIISWPKKVPQGITDSQTILSAVDLMPSLIGIAGLNGNSEGDGEDKSQAFTGTPIIHHRPIMWEYGSAQGGTILSGHDKHVSPNLAIMEDGWKLLINVDSTRAELYHIDKDPFEAKNLVEDNPELAHVLAAKVLNWRRGYPIPPVE